MNLNDLTQKQIDELWGDRGPYSQAQLIVEERILDDAISRIFLIVSVNVNPFTFKYVRKHKNEFKGNMFVQELLRNSTYQNQKDGFSCYAFQCEFYDDSVMQEAQMMLEGTRNAVLEMHRFVMKELGLKIKKQSKKQDYKNVINFDDYKKLVH
ncbi:hypothetical protein KKA47_03930 [bacterium]|nr:hypothetical protein [bacterium]